MPHYLTQWKLTATSVKALIEHPQDRRPVAAQAVEAFAGKVEAWYNCMGEFDGVAITEYPDEKAAVAARAAFIATGAFERFETTPLFSSKFMEGALHHAQGTKSAYRPPNS